LPEERQRGQLHSQGLVEHAVELSPAWFMILQVDHTENNNKSWISYHLKTLKNRRV